MRRGRDNGWLKNTTQGLFGINLGADFCAEHEGGIRHIYKAFGISDNPEVFGIDRRRVTLVPGGVLNLRDLEPLEFRKFTATKQSRATLIFDRWGAKKHTEYLELALPKYYAGSTPSDDPYFTFSTAWDEGSFGIHVKGQDNVNALAQIHDAILRKDMAIWTGGGHVFQRAGLILGIISKCPPESLAEMYRADENASELVKAGKATGIAEFLKEKGKEWYALSPQWTSKDRVQLDPPETTYPVMFWLNPRQQDKYHSNYFTVEELRLWAEEKGPVIKEKVHGDSVVPHS